LETDAPDIAPEWISGQRNDPSQLQRIAQVLADLRGIPVAEVMAQTTANAHAVLPRLVA
jgi:TatD DNase family protein